MNKNTEGLLRTIPGLANINRPAFERGTAMDEWEESKHPRDENGQFGSSGGGNKGESSETKNLIKDKNGKPIVLYHGTNKSFKNFSLKHAGSSDGGPGTGEGFFFTASQRHADHYAKSAVSENGGKHTVLKRHVAMKNPRVIDAKSLEDEGDYADVDYEISQAKKEGNDGVIFKNYAHGPEQNGTPMRDDMYFVFDPKNIKEV